MLQCVDGCKIFLFYFVLFFDWGMKCQIFIFTGTENDNFAGPNFNICGKCHNIGFKNSRIGMSMRV
jgi:hypothetical protein